MHAHLHLTPFDAVLLDLRNVVRHVVHLPQLRRDPRVGKDGIKALAHEHRQHLPVGKRKVGRRLHRREIGAAFGRVERRTDQLAIGQHDVVALHHTLKIAHVVRAHLVAQAARAAVDQHHHLVVAQPIGVGHVVVVDLDHAVHLQKMVARPQCAQLAAPTLARLAADHPGLGTFQAAVGFGVQQVLRGGEVLVETPAGAPTQYIVHLTIVERERAASPHSAGTVLVERCRQLVEIGLERRIGQVAGQKPHATVDVVPDAAGRDHTVRQRRGRHAPHRKTVPLVHIRHGDGIARHARQRGRIDQLLHTAVGQRLFEQGTAGINPRRHAHIGTKRLGDLPDILVDLFHLLEPNHMSKKTSAFQPSPSRPIFSW